MSEEINVAFRDAVQAVVIYLQDEHKDGAETGGANHISNSVKVLQKWLGESKGSCGINEVEIKEPDK